MYFPNTQHQGGLHRAFRADGTLASSSLPQLILPVADSRASLYVQNVSAAAMWLEHGCATAYATISGGAVSAVTVVNGGFGYTVPPVVSLEGGGGNFVTCPTASAWLGYGEYGSPAPNGLSKQGDTTAKVYQRPAVVTANLQSGAVSSFTVVDGGAGYINTPMVIIRNDPRDPFGCADPSINITGSINSGVYLAASGGSYSLQGPTCHTDQIALFGTSGSAFVLEWMV